MRPAEISDAEIIEAGTQLQAQGTNVTGFSLRKRTGRGSPARLSQVWQTYVATASVAPAVAAELPVEVADDVAKVVADVGGQLHRVATLMYDKAVRTAERRVAELVRATKEQQAQADQELADASVAFEEMEDRFDTQSAEIESLKEQLASARSSIQGQAIELAKAGEHLVSERQRNEILKSELAQARSDGRDAAVLQGKVDALTEQNANLMAHLNGRGAIAPSHD
uniref:KfrA N-terminal DNA-binding domain-containing protein n=1 Tax=Stenotrophomonas maltophilia TaxID=40324 RepID=Q7WZM7_STEMA|nr:hypothetical protein [Stenotrophomonas maltophilia]